MTLRRFSSAKKFLGANVRIYLQGDPKVTSRVAAALLQNDAPMITVANRVIAIRYQSVIAVWRVKAESRRVEASAFYRSTTQKCKPKFSTVRFTVGQDFDAKPRNSATHCESKMTNYVRSATICKAIKRCPTVRLELRIR